MRKLASSRFPHWVAFLSHGKPPLTKSKPLNRSCHKCPDSPGSFSNIQIMFLAVDLMAPLRSYSKSAIQSVLASAGVSPSPSKSTSAKSLSASALRSFVSKTRTVLSLAAKSCIFRYDGKRVISVTRLPSSCTPKRCIRQRSKALQSCILAGSVSW